MANCAPRSQSPLGRSGDSRTETFDKVWVFTVAEDLLLSGNLPLIGTLVFALLYDGLAYAVRMQGKER